ncbi:MAG: methyltransferase domain-containing protein [Dermatophilaceae bacterium]
MSVSPENYIHGHAPSVLRSHSTRTVANSAAYLADRLVPGVTVLDVGCGPGTISVDIAARVAPGTVVAIDSAAEPLAAARANGTEPDAGRHLLSWARAAGASSVAPTASVWCWATPEDRSWWGEMWSERIVDSAIAGQAIAGGHADRAELRSISQAWQQWAADDDGWFTVLHGEIICTP